MKNRIYYLLLFISPLISNGQEVPEYILDGAFTKDHNVNKVAAYDYPEIQEKDIVWSRTIWREIDLRQKINHHFYYPIAEKEVDINPDNMSLSDVIFTALHENARNTNATVMAPANVDTCSINKCKQKHAENYTECTKHGGRNAPFPLDCFKPADEPIPGKEFHSGIMNPTDVLNIGIPPLALVGPIKKMDGNGLDSLIWIGKKSGKYPQKQPDGTIEDVLITNKNYDANAVPPFPQGHAQAKHTSDKTDSTNFFESAVQMKFNTSTITKWRIKEEVFFDKKRSVMKTRIIGLCPVVEDYSNASVINSPVVDNFELFWIYYPAFREVLAKTNVLNITKNDAQKRSFLDIFEKRMFSSRIIMESNIMNRRISDYMIGLDALLEGNRIQEEMFNIEHDLWEY